MEVLMRKLQTDTISNLIIYETGKPIEEVEREYGLTGGTVKLASNENPLGSSPKALEAMRKALSTTNRYPDGGGYYLRKKLSERLGFPMEQIILGNGSCEIIEMAAKAFIMPGENTVMSKHAFIIGYIATLAVNGSATLVPMKEDLKHDLDAMADTIDENTKIVYIANPNNPTGTYVNRDELDRFMDRIPKDIVVVLDEAYFEFIGKDDFPDGTKYITGDRRVLVLRTFSKIYGLAGLRIGYGIGSKEIISGLARIRSPFNTSSLGQIGAIAALDDDDFLNESVRVNGEEMDFLYGEFDQMGLKYTPSVTNFILAHCEMDCTELFQKLLKKGVIVRPMKGYGLPKSFRVSIGNHSENLRFLEAFKEVREGR